MRLLAGHFDLPFWLRRKLADRFIVTVLREPVERLLSAYRYAKSWTQHPRHEAMRQMSVAQYVDAHVSDESRHNWQCRKLCGSPDFGAALAMAQRQIDLVGAVELIAPLTESLSEALGVPLEARNDNASPDQRPRREDLDGGLLSKLQSCNVEDFKLWASVIERGLLRGHRNDG